MKNIFTTHISLAKENSRYFAINGKPTLLITSGEHYGSLINGDLDYLTYFDTLARHGFNLTRTFSGLYRENPEGTLIRHNTLAPTHFISPLDEAYPSRLRDYMAAANARGIVVEFVFFSFLYGDDLWQLNPMYEEGIDRKDVYRMDSPLLEMQKEWVTTLCQILEPFDNVILEPINEPYTIPEAYGRFNRLKQYFLPDQTHRLVEDWQVEMLHHLRECAPTKLIAQNIANNNKALTTKHPAVDILNFHYATPQAAVENWHLSCPVCHDETGFAGNDPEPYRKEAWRFLLSGGASFNHLDYSYTAAHPDGTQPLDSRFPGGGGPIIRGQLEILREFITSIPFHQMQAISHPDCTLLAKADDTYAFYTEGEHPIHLMLPANEVEWWNPITGERQVGATTYPLQPPSGWKESAGKALA